MGAVAWLVNYLVNIKDTTVVVVSHDAEFMEKTVTDVIHLNVCTSNAANSVWSVACSSVSTRFLYLQILYMYLLRGLGTFVF